MLHRTDDGGRRRIGDGRFFTMTGSYNYSPDVAGEGTRGIVEAIGAQFRPSPSRYARSSLMTFGRGDQNVPAVSAEVPTGGRGRAIVALAIVVGVLLLLR